MEDRREAIINSCNQSTFAILSELEHIPALIDDLDLWNRIRHYVRLHQNLSVNKILNVCDMQPVGMSRNGTRT